MKLDILAIGAHPDDVELGCGATIAKEIAAGKRVGIIDLTRGELGSRGTAEIRDQEAAQAARILGVHWRHNMRFMDGFFVNDAEHQRALIKMIRYCRPDVVLCNAVDDRHIDHAKGSRLGSEACFLSGLIKIQTTYEGKSQDPWRPAQVYHYIQWKNSVPDFVVDVSGFINRKEASVMAYASQFYDPSIDSMDMPNPDRMATKQVNTPISSSNFKASIVYRAADLGRLIGVDHAEGFTVERPLAVRSLFDLK